MFIVISELLISIISIQSPESVHILGRVKKIENFSDTITMHMANLFILNIQENSSDGWCIKEFIFVSMNKLITTWIYFLKHIAISLFCPASIQEFQRSPNPLLNFRRKYKIPVTRLSYRKPSDLKVPGGSSKHLQVRR